MNYKTFKDLIVEQLHSHFDEPKQITIHVVKKNNGVQLDGLVILEKDMNIAPTIYLNYYYEKYKNGTCFSEIFDELLKDTLGKTINIDKDLEGFEVDGHFNKYAFNDRASELAKGWETQEYRDALEDIAKFSKLLIQSIPMFSRKTRKQSP